MFVARCRITFCNPQKWGILSDFCLKTAQNQGVFPVRCPFKSNKRSHSGDDGDEDPPVPIPCEQRDALPRLQNGNGRRQKLSSSTAKVVGKKRLRGYQIAGFQSKMTVFQRKNGHFSFVLEIFCSARFIFFVARFLL